MGDVCREIWDIAAGVLQLEENASRMAADELRELRQLREENGKLKTLVADLTLDKHTLTGSAIVGVSEACGTPGVGVECAAGSMESRDEPVSATGQIPHATNRYRSRRDRPGRFASAAAGAGRHANSLRLSSADRIAAAGRSRSQCEAGFTGCTGKKGCRCVPPTG